MTLDRDINHSLSENKSIRLKACKLFRHLASVELFGFDRLQKEIIYLFFYYLMVKDKNNEEIKKTVQEVLSRYDIIFDCSTDDGLMYALDKLNFKEKFDLGDKNV